MWKHTVQLCNIIHETMYELYELSQSFVTWDVKTLKINLIFICAKTIKHCNKKTMSKAFICTNQLFHKTQIATFLMKCIL